MLLKYHDPINKYFSNEYWNYIHTPTCAPSEGDPFVGEQEWLMNKVLMFGFGIGFLHNWCCQFTLHTKYWQTFLIINYKNKIRKHCKNNVV